METVLTLPSFLLLQIIFTLLLHFQLDIFQFTVLRDDFRLEPQNTRIAQGDTALLECAPPRGTPEPTVIWRKNGQKLEVENSKRIRIVDGGNLAIQDTRQTDEGQYQCVAKNIVGVRESSIASLKVYG